MGDLVYVCVKIFIEKGVVRAVAENYDKLKLRHANVPIMCVRNV